MLSKKIGQFIYCFFFLLSSLVSAQEPKLILPIGHTSLINTARFSPDGEKIVSASADGTAKIWDVSTGFLLADLKGHTAIVRSAEFSPDGKKIVTASVDNTAKIWDAVSGNLLVDLKGHTSAVNSAQFSPDGKQVVTSSEDGTAKIWDAATGSIQADLIGHISQVWSARFSPDGKKIVTASGDKTTKVWDAVTGKLLTDLKGHNNWVTYAEFTPDGKKIVTASHDKTAKIWDVKTGNLFFDLQGHSGWVNSARFSQDGKKIVTASEDNTAKIWDVETGKLVFDLKGHTSQVWSAQFSPDGKKVVTGSWDNMAKVWNALNGSFLFDLAGHDGAVNNPQFSPDGKKIVTASNDKTAKIWDASGGFLLADLKGHSDIFFSAQFSPDGKKIVTLSGDSSVKIWDADKLTLIASLRGHTDFVNYAAFSPDGNKIVTASDDATAKVWDAATGTMLADLRGQTSEVWCAQFSPDGKKIVTASLSGIAKIWDAVTGRTLVDLKGHSNSVSWAGFSPDGKKIITASWDSTAKIWDADKGTLSLNLKGHVGKVLFAKFSPDGKKIITASRDNSAKIWDAGNGSLLADLVAHSNEITSVEFSADGKRIVTASKDGTAKIWDADKGLLLVDLPGNNGVVKSAKFSADSKKIVTANKNSTAIIWDAVTGSILANLKGHTSDVLYAEFSPDSKKIITASADNTCKIWNAETGENLFTFFDVDAGDYLTIDKNNRYDGTDAARKLLYFTCGTEIIGLDQVKDQLWIPNLAERINKGETINSKTLNDLNICGLTPEVKDVSTADELHFTTTPRRGGLGETVVLVNGIEAKRFKPEQLQNTQGGYELAIKKEDLKDLFIAGKQNPVTVKAYTADNTITSRGAVVQVDESKETTTPPNLYALMIGISDYKGNELDLKYAAKDATDFSAAISNAAKKLLNTHDSNHVFIYNLTTAETHYLLPEKNSIKNVLEEIGKKATANDILLIFFAGHGVMAGDGDKKQFYFLTADASTFSTTDAVKDVGISTAELSEWMKPQNIKAQKRILIFDACNSGQAINDFVKLGNDNQNYLGARNDDKSQQIKAIDKLNEKSGLFILSASASSQSAYEMGRYSQGLLTYSLLKVIKQEPDILDDGKYLDVSRWFNAAGKTVSEIAKESGARQDPQIITNTNFNIGIVDDDVLKKIILPEEKPLFSGSNFQNADENIAADDLGLNKLTNQQLNELSSKGADATISFIAGSGSPDAYTLNGRYTITGNDITLKLIIRQQNEVKQKIDIAGTKDKLDDLAALVAKKAAEWSRGVKNTDSK